MSEMSDTTPTTAAPSDAEIVRAQRGQLVEDGRAAGVVRNGYDLAALLNAMGVYADAAVVLVGCGVGAVVKTGVSAYERIK